MIFAISFKAGVLGLEIAMDREGKWVMDFNTDLLVAGPQTSGKTPAAKALINEPFKRSCTVHFWPEFTIVLKIRVHYFS